MRSVSGDRALSLGGGPLRRSRGAALLLAGLLAAGCDPGSSRRPSRFDLLVVTLDTTRADRIGAYGYSAARTPEIDALAARGVRFSDAFAPAPTTLPSHTSLFTGLYPPRHGVRANGSFTLGAERTTLAERLETEGYRTAAFIGAFPLDSRFGLDQGFESYDDGVHPRDGTSAPVMPERAASEVTDSALGWLRETADDDRPLFVWAHYFDPHAPYEPPAPWQGYDGEIAFVDTQIGRLLRGFDEVRDLERTLIVLAGDHGESLGEHGEKTHDVFVYDATLRVPLVLANEALVGEARVVDDRIVSLVDVFPTVLDLLGIEDPHEVDGISLLADPPPADRAVYFEAIEPLLLYGWSPLRGLRTSDAKLIETRQPEYYVLRDDPGEQRNRFETEADSAARLLARLHEEFGQADTEELLPHAVEVDPEVVERLASLGYVGTRSAALPAARRDPKVMLPLWDRIGEVYAFVESRRFDDALRVCDGIVGGDPDNGRAWLVRGIVLQAMGRLPEAEASVRNAVRLLPAADTFSRLAEILFVQDRFAEGDAAVEEARRIDPRSGMVSIAEGVGATLRHRYDEALRAFEQARTLDPANSGTRAAELAAAVEKMR